VLLLGVLVSSGVPADAAAPSGPGAVCQFSSTTDPTVEGDVQTGQISGGPLVTVNVDSTNPTASGPQSGTLHCWVQVASDVPTSGPGVSGHGTGVVTAGPAQISYTATVDQNVYLCSTWTDDADGVTYYFDDTTSDFTTTAVPCGLAISASAPPGLVCVAVSGCSNRSSTVCVAGTGCNNTNSTVCVAVDGCQPGATVCVAVHGCGATPICLPVVGCVIPVPSKAVDSGTSRAADRGSARTG
jgi:hypothetical protein